MKFDSVPTLSLLMRRLQQVPYLASKNMYRVASYFLTLDQENLEQFCRVLLQAKQNIILCPECFAWQEKGMNCSFCTDHRRDKGLICVVESWQELMTIENSGGYKGVYHILGGVICPLEGIGPEQLTISALVKRAEKNIHEIILATNQTPEGEATASYIASKLKDSSVRISISGLAHTVLPEQLFILYPALGAIFSGAVAGDHISPISETTIMASTSAGAHPLDHAYTQIAYALPAIFCTAIAFMLISLPALDSSNSPGMSWLITSLISLSICCIILQILNKKGKTNDK